MKKVIFSTVAITLLCSASYAGKNVVKADVPPLPVPEKPIKPMETAVPPLGIYIGGGYTYAHGECHCNPVVNGQKASTSDTHGINLKAGYDFFEYAGVEAKYLYTPWGDTDKTMKHYGIYFKPMYPVSDNIDVYGLLGYGKTECETLNNSFKGFSWGLGAEYTLDAKKGKKSGLGIYAEYLQPLRKSGSENIKTHTGSVGLAYHF